MKNSNKHKALKTLLATVTVTSVVSPTVSEAGVQFNDIDNAWAKTDIQYLANQGIVSGYGDGTYRPNISMNRQTFGALIAKTLVNMGYALPQNSTKSFDDVADWAKEDIESLAELGIFSGYGNGTFGALDDITREQATIVFVRLLGYEDEAHALDLPLNFKDADKISTSAKKSVAFANHIGLVNGHSDGTFGPHESANRQTIAALTARLHQNVNTYVSNAENLVLKYQPLSVENNGFINLDNTSDYIIKGIAPKNATVEIELTDGLNTISDSVLSNDVGEYVSTNLDVSTLIDGEVTVSVKALDANGNELDVEEIIVVKDVVAPELPIIKNGSYIDKETNQEAYIVLGSAEANKEVKVSLTDGTEIIEKIISSDENGDFKAEVNTTILAEGKIAITASVTDEAGNSSVGLKEVTKDVTIVGPQLDNNGVVSSQNETTYGFTGKVESDAIVMLSVSDGESEIIGDTMADAMGNFNLTLDLSSLNDGSLVITSAQADKVLNVSEKVTKPLTKDTVGPTAITIDNSVVVNSNNEASYSISGTTESNATLDIVVSDGVNAEVITNATADVDGNYSVNADLTSLNEGTLTVKAIVTDAYGNLGTSYESTFTKDTQAPNGLTVVSENSGVVNSANESTYTFNGISDEDGAGVELTVTDGTNSVSGTATVSSGIYTLDIDLSPLNEGTLDVNAIQTDANGNKSSVVAIQVNKDTEVVAPVINNTGTVNASEVSSYAITGTVEANATVIVTISDGTKTIKDSSVVADASGVFSTTLDISSMNDGSVSIFAEQTDASGNKSILGDSIITVDTVAPNSPIISNTGFINSNTVGAYTITGTAEANSTVDVTLTDSAVTANVITTQVVADVNGNYSIDVDTNALIDGGVTIDAKATDVAGNIGTIGSAIVTKDVVADSAPVVNNAGFINETTTQATYAVTGTGVSDNSLNVTVTDSNGDFVSGIGTVATDGTYNVAVDTTTLAEGDLIVAVTQTDLAGNTSVEGTAAVVKDTVANAPVITNTNYVNLSNYQAYDVIGTVEPNSSVNVSVTDGTNTVSGTATADINGDFVVTVNTDDGTTILAEGTLTIEATQVDVAGNSSLIGSANVTKDVTAPSAAVVSNTEYIDASNQTSYEVYGTAEANAVIDITLTDGVNTVTNQVNADGSGIYTALLDVSTLAEGSVTIDATQTDVAGNTGLAGSAAVTKDTVAPIAVTLDDNGVVNEANVVGYTISGVAELDTTVDIVISDGDDATADVVVTNVATNASTGVFSTSVDMSTQNDGTLTVSVLSKDLAGNISSETLQNITKDASEPIAPNITNTGYINANEETGYTLVGATEANATVDITITDSASTAMTVPTITADADGNFSAIIDVSTLAEGSLTIDSVATDTNGNVGVTGTTSLTKDTLGPIAPVITDNGSVNSNNSASYTISGTTEGSASLKIVVSDGVNADVVANTVADTSGNYSVNADLTTFNDGSLTVTVTPTDVAGNGGTSQSSTLTKDTVAPDAPTVTSENGGVVNAGNVTTYTFNGTASEDGSTVKIVVTDGTNSINGMATVSSGAYTLDIDLSTLVDGTLDVSATQIDVNGNEGATTTSQISKDTIALAPGVSNTGFINSSDEATYEVAGTAEVGSTVDITLTDSAGTPNIITAQVVADENGDYSILVDTTTLIEGSVLVEAIQTDAVGNVSSVGSSTVTKDLTAPNAPMISNTGYVNETTETAYEVTGTSEANATVHVSVTDGTSSVTATTIADGSGTYLVPIDVSSLSDGSLTIEATQDDEAGNVGTLIGNATVTKDTVKALTVTAIDHTVSSNGVGDSLNKVTFVWDDSTSADVSGYEIYRSTLSGEIGNKVSDIAIGAGTYGEDVNINTTYYYTIVTIDNAGNKTSSTQQEVITGAEK